MDRLRDMLARYGQIALEQKLFKLGLTEVTTPQLFILWPQAAARKSCCIRSDCITTEPAPPSKLSSMIWWTVDVLRLETLGTVAPPSIPFAAAFSATKNVLPLVSAQSPLYWIQYVLSIQAYVGRSSRHRAFSNSRWNSFQATLTPAWWSAAMVSASVFQLSSPRRIDAAATLIDERVDLTSPMQTGWGPISIQTVSSSTVPIFCAASRAARKLTVSRVARRT